MLETLALLLFAHVLADFLLQTDRMVASKHRLPGLAAHGAVVLTTLVLTTGSLSSGLFALTGAHLGIDLIKQGSGRRGPGAFLWDQALHLASLALLAMAEPGLWASGLWAPAPALPGLSLVLAGAIAATRAGGYFVALLIAPWMGKVAQGLSGAGRMIGLLERSVIFVLILTGHPEGVGFLIAAKSILRFSETREDRLVSEYVIIGTLASFLWAILCAEAVLIGLSALPPLGISRPTS